jgi:membrane-bound lytic murein transglycosylase F
MNRKIIRNPKDAFVLMLFVILIGFTGYLLLIYQPESHETTTTERLAQIIERDTLIAITDNTSTSYFLYKGQPLGYQYELLTQFADHLNVALKIVVASTIDEGILRLTAGEADLIAMDLTVTAPRKEILLFTQPIHQTNQVLVQRTPNDEEKEGQTHTLIRNHADLENKTVFVQTNSSHRMRMRNLAAEIGANINIIESPYDSEELIAMVAEGEIDYTVADQHTAMANQTWYENLDILTEVSFPQDIAWAMPHGSDSLQSVINKWIGTFTQTRAYKRLFRKYFVSKKAAHLKDNRYHSMRGGKLSPYDDLIREKSKEGPWDWRLVAAVIYHESRFNPKARSWAGATGLMQLMPGTARRFGVKNIYSPKEQLSGGVALITYLHENLPDEITDPIERAKYVLASYNIGMSHITDAINLAKKYGEDPASWEVGEKYLLLKSQPKYYNDPVVKAGYARGRETRRFVAKVMNQYQHYRTIMPD